MKQIPFGIDNFLLRQKEFNYLRFALVTNNAATTSSGELSRVTLLKDGLAIKKIFSPEHGLTAKGEDGAFQNHTIDLLTQLPVVSLYGDHLMPTEEDLKDIDAVLFDIPDVGCRFYTYLWTMTYVMEACALHNKKLIILDRPNPIGGSIKKAEGPMLDESTCSSFIGRWNIPVRHSCTLGELATYFAAGRINNLDFKIIKAAGWSRNQTALDASWNFVPTSPAIKDIETALLYPGLGLMEGINVNEGRGTDSSFKIIGAPWINAEKLNTTFSDLNLQGIKSVPINYIPSAGLYANEKCNGLHFYITNSKEFNPVQTGLKLLLHIASLYPEKCSERLYPTVANPSGSGHLDKLTGVYNCFEKIKKGELLLSNIQQADWKEIIQPYLLY